MRLVRGVATRLGAGRVRRRVSGTARGVAGGIARRERLPTSLRAVLGHYARSGVLDLSALALRSRVETAIEGMVRTGFDAVERVLAAEYDADPRAVEFDYGTKLLLPAELTLARRYRSAIERAPDGFDPVARRVDPGPLGGLWPAVAGEDDPAGAVWPDPVDPADPGDLIGVLDGRDRPADDRRPDGRTSVDRRADDGSTTADPADGDRTTGRERPARSGSTGAGARDPVDPAFSPLVREVRAVDRVTELVVLALLDGDMRDAVNDREYGDFEATVPGADPDPERVARLAQRTLQAAVERRFERFPEEVRTAYDRAVAASEAHQDRDDRFRRLYAIARGDATGGDRASGGPVGADDATDADDADDGSGDPDTDRPVAATEREAREQIRGEYRDGFPEGRPSGYDPLDLTLPYFGTQYGRVGVIYDGMFDMYEAAGFPVDPEFRRAVVLMTIGAQVWLDDVDDFAADRREGQLTPVTAEYLLADSEDRARRQVVETAERYADRAREYADRSGSTLVGIAVEYIQLSGDPDALPGNPDAPGAPDDPDALPGDSTDALD